MKSKSVIYKPIQNLYPLILLYSLISAQNGATTQCQNFTQNGIQIIR